MCSMSARHLWPALILAWTLAIVATPARAVAQTSLQPFEGLFPGLNGDTSKQRLDLTFALSESYDNDVPTEIQQLVPGAATSPLQAGFSTLWLGGVNYRRHRHVQFQTTLNSALRYSPEAIQRVQNVGQTGGLLLSIPLPARTSLTMTENAAYSPALLQGLFLAQSADVDLSAITSISRDYTTRQSDAYFSTTTLSLSRTFGRRSHLDGSADYQYNNYPDTNGNRRHLTVYGGRTEFSRGFGRGTSFRATYHYRTGEYGFENLGTTAEHGVELSIENSRRLSAHRRATVGFSLGSSTIGIPEAATVVGATVRRRYPTTGEGRLALQFERSWQFRASYSRGLQYVGDVGQPIVADRLGFALDGLLTKRTDLQMSAAYSNGDGALITGTRFKSYNADVRWRGAVTNTLAGFVEGYLYVYDFNGAPIELGLPQQLNHVGARVGLMLWIPTLGRAGRSGR
jgi:hypothetical protein